MVVYVVWLRNAINLGFRMNIYHCYRDFSGYALSAVVQASTEERAIELLGWEVDEDTLSIDVKKIGIADADTEREWCEESL